MRSKSSLFISVEDGIDVWKQHAESCAEFIDLKVGYKRIPSRSIAKFQNWNEELGCTWESSCVENGKPKSVQVILKIFH